MPQCFACSRSPHNVLHSPSIYIIIEKKVRSASLYCVVRHAAYPKLIQFNTRNVYKIRILQTPQNSWECGEQETWKFHAKTDVLEMQKCTTCSEGFPGLQLRSHSTECVRCNRDKHVPKLYSSMNNIGPGVLYYNSCRFVCHYMHVAT